MKVNVFPRIAIIKMAEVNEIDFKKVNIISINTLYRNCNELEIMQEHLGKNNPNVLYMQFDDVTKEVAEFYNSKNPEFKLTPINENQAKQIVNFIIETHKQGKDLFVHCTAGISRSGAVGLFANQYINKFINKNEDDFYHNEIYGFDGIIPNPTVSSMLNSVV